MNNSDSKLRRINVMIKNLNKEINKCFDVGVYPNIELIDVSKASDRQIRLNVLLSNLDKFK